MFSKLIYASFIMLAAHAIHAMEQQHPAEEIASQIVALYQTTDFLAFHQLVSSSANVIKDPNSNILYRCITSTPVVWHPQIALLIKQGAHLHIHQEAELEKITAKTNSFKQCLSLHRNFVKGQQNKEAIENYSLMYNTLASACNQYRSAKRHNIIDRKNH